MIDGVLANRNRSNVKQTFAKTILSCLLLSSAACAPIDDDFAASVTSDEYDAGLEDLSDKALSTTHQAENRTAQSGCTTSTAHEGYSGTGFVDYGGDGSWIEWSNINMSQAGEYTLALKYANDSSDDREVAVIVNGKSIGDLAFAPTDGWSAWKSVSIRATLRAGANTIRLMASTSAGGPNLDSMVITGSDSSGSVRDLEFVSFSKLQNEVTTFNNVSAKYVVYAESHGREGHDDIRSSQPGFVGMRGATLVGYGGGRDKYLAIFRVNSSTVVIDKDQAYQGRDGGSGQALFIKTSRTLTVAEARSVDPSVKSENVPGTRSSSEIVVYAEDEGGKGDRDQFFMPRAHKYYGSGDDLLYVFAQSLSGGPNGNGAFMRLSIR